MLMIDKYLYTMVTVVWHLHLLFLYQYDFSTTCAARLTLCWARALYVCLNLQAMTWLGPTSTE